MCPDASSPSLLVQKATTRVVAILCTLLNLFITGTDMFIHLHHLNDQQDILDSAACQRPPNDLGLQHGAEACSQTKRDTNNVLVQFLAISNTA